MTKNKRIVAAKLKAEAARRQAPVQRRAIARQKAAQTEAEQVYYHAHMLAW